MSDEKKEGPAYPPTTRLPRVEVPQNTLDAVLTEVRAMRADVHLVANDVTIIKERVRIVEMRVDDIEDRGTKHSGGIAKTSDHNLEQDAAIASVIVRVDNVEKKVDTVLEKTDAQTVMLTEAKDAAKKLWANPAAKALASALWMALIYWLGSKGIKVP